MPTQVTCGQRTTSKVVANTWNCGDLTQQAPATYPSTSPFAVGFGIFAMGMRTTAHPTFDFFLVVVVSSAVSRR